MQIEFVWTLLISLGITIILELAFALIFKVRRVHDLLLIVVVNIITNPAVVLLHYLLVQRAGLPQILVVILLETTAILVEGFYYKRYAENVNKPFVFSLGANAFSYFTGLLINNVF